MTESDPQTVRVNRRPQRCPDFPPPIARALRDLLNGVEIDVTRIGIDAALILARIAYCIRRGEIEFPEEDAAESTETAPTSTLRAEPDFRPRLP